MPQTLSNLAYETADLTVNSITADDEPADNLFSAKQPRLLVEPHIAVEIVSNRKGNELASKTSGLRTDRRDVISRPRPVQEFGRKHSASLRTRFRQTLAIEKRCGSNRSGLEARLWRGEYEGVSGESLRWYDAGGDLILTGKETAEKMTRKPRDLGIDF